MKVFWVLRHDQRGYTLAELLITVAILGLVMAAVLGVQMSSSKMFLRGENQAEAQQGARAAMLMEEDLRMAGYGCPDNGCPTPPPGPANQQKISAGTASSVTFWADTQNVSTALTANVAIGATTLPVTSAASIAVNDRIYLTNGGTWETRVVTGVAGNNLTVAGLTNAYPQGVQVGRPRTITYSYANGTLSRDAGDGNGLQTLATGVTGFVFTYYPTSDTGTPITLTGAPASVPAASLSTIGRIQITTSTQSSQSASGYSTFTINTNVRPRNL
jgi:prepilin-type N-terminal cleavage/methylation domain-containing protein